MLGVGLQLMLNVRDCARRVALVQLQWTMALLAAKLGVAIENCIRDALKLPERLVTTGGAHAAALDFAFEKLLWDRCSFRCHDLLSSCS